jgi:hypothetical protein
MKPIASILLSMILVLFAVPAKAQQISSNAATVSLSFVSSASLSITATPASISFNSAGVASGPITVVTAWNLSSAYHGIIGYAYFSSSAALTGPANIPASGISVVVDGQNQTFTTSDPSGGNNGVQYTGANNINFPAKPFSGSQTDTLLLSIPNSGSYSPGTYTGVLNFMAIAA